jgi:hypothetical protein
MTWSDENWTVAARDYHRNGGDPMAQSIPLAPGVQRFITGARLIGQDDPLDGPQWIIPGVLQEHQTAIMPGPPGSGKSFAILDWFARVVRDRPFLGGAVLPGGAVYVTGEGQGGLAKRVAALAQEFELTDADAFLYLRVMPRLLDPQEVKDFIAAIKVLTAAWTVPIRVIGFDTFNRAIVGGSESEGKDVAKLLDADSKIKEAFGCATIYAHHPGKAEGNFSRGHSSLQGDPDVVAAFSGKSGTRTIEIKKQKDDEDGNVIGYSLRQVRLGNHVKTGEPVTTCVVDWVEGSTIKAPNATTWPKSLTQLLQALTTAAVESGFDHKIPDGPMVKAVKLPHVRGLFLKRYIDGEDDGKDHAEAAKKAWTRAIKTARDSNLIAGEQILGKQIIWSTKGG